MGVYRTLCCCEVLSPIFLPMPAPRFKPLATTDFLTMPQISAAELGRVLKTAGAIKKKPKTVAKALAGRGVVMLFEKPSLRTRVSFEVGITRLGGHALYYDHGKERIGQRESIHDYAKVLERFCDAIVARVYEQRTLEELAQHAEVPIINALSNTHHPCQALADVLTMTEHLGGVKGRKIVYIGDGNNVAVSLAQAVVMLGGEITIIAPRGHQLSDADAAGVLVLATASGGSITLSDDPGDAKGVDCIYTDTWVSMHDTDAAVREKAFAGYQVNAALMKTAAKKAIFMHCLPAHRGHEVTDEVLDSAQSVAWDQAENRLWAQNALLLHLLT
jgi:ornithine carbamoyltransferase